MNVYWLEQTEADVPAENDWLSANEAVCLNTLRFPKRRADWRLGRWTAKCALSAYLSVPAALESFKEIEICAAPDGAPEAFVGGRPARVSISLSHRSGIAICAVAASDVYLGCDLEMVERRSDAFIADYFTAKEQARVARATAGERDRIVTLLWSAKECALKALRTGLRMDTRSVIVNPFIPSVAGDGWSPMIVRHVGYCLPKDRLPDDGHSEGRYLDGHVFHGWWQDADNVVRTIVATPPPDSPLPLTVPEHGIEKAWKFESKFA